MSAHAPIPTITFLGPRVDAERVKALHDSLRFVLGANIVAATLVGVLQVARSGGTVILLWCAALIAVTVLRAVGRHYSRPLLGRPDKVPTLYWQFLLGSFASGCLWGALGLIGYGAEGSHEFILIVLVLAGMTAGAVSSLSAFFEIYAAFAIPTLTPIMLRLCVDGEGQSITEAALGLTFLLVNLGYSRQYQAILRETIALRFQREELIHDLTAEKLRVEQASRAKSQFIAGISHDIRQPIHAIALLTDSIERDSAERARQPIEAIKKALSGLDRLLESFLDIAKIEAGVVQPNIRPIHLQTVFDDLFEELRPWAAEKGLTLRVVRTRATVATDPTLLMRVLRNLAVNAVKHTATGGVVIGCRRTGSGRIRIEVCDTGVGIRADRLQSIFREFYTGSFDETPEPGLGLGLAIADGLAQTLGTKVEVRSVLGRGSVFALALPVLSRPMDVAPELTPEAAVQSLAGRRIFLVDDEQVIVDAMEELLRAWDCQVTSARSINSALTKLAQGEEPEILVLDQRLRAGETGDHLLRKIDQLLGRYLPAIVITGDTAPELHHRAGGIRVVMYKPVTPLKLRAALAKTLAR